jgi:hypothetical protein
VLHRDVRPGGGAPAERPLGTCGDPGCCGPAPDGTVFEPHLRDLSVSGDLKLDSSVSDVEGIP